MAAAHRSVALAELPAWQIQIGTLSGRCVMTAIGFEVQARTKRGWEPVCSGTDPGALLRRWVAAAPVTEELSGYAAVLESLR